MGFFLSTTAVSRPTLGATQPPNEWVSGDISPGIRRAGREADYSPPHKAIPPITIRVLMAWCLVKHTDNFTFSFTPRQVQGTMRWANYGDVRSARLLRLSLLLAVLFTVNSPTALCLSVCLCHRPKQSQRTAFCI
jgi:hypothetical protein